MGVYIPITTNENAVLTVLPMNREPLTCQKAPDYARLGFWQAVRDRLPHLPRWISFQPNAI